MAGTFLLVGSGGSIYWIDPVANFASLPASPPTGTVALTVNTGTLYFFNSGSWSPVTAAADFISSVTDTNSVDLTVALGTLTADVRLSGNAATAGFFKATTTIQSTSSVGLHVELPIATGSQTGVISSTDWTTFNAKEPAISAGTTSQYWRGDKTFQTLQMSALTAVTGGGAAGAGTIGEILTGTQASATATGVGATGTFGNATSVSLTAGVWAITGVAGFAENAAVLTTSLSAGISDSSTGAGIGAFDYSVNNSLSTGASDLQLTTPTVYVSISGTTTYYLNTRFYYTSGSPQHYGKIQALRIR